MITKEPIRLKGLLSPVECNQVLDLGLASAMEAGTVFADDPSVNPLRRQSDVCWIELPEHIDQRLDHLIRNHIAPMLDVDVDDIPSRYQFTRYAERNFYDWHFDVTWRNPIRKVSVVILLSHPDAFAGGQLRFRDFPESDCNHLEQGEAVFFPSYLSHTVKPVETGVRYSLVNWATGPTWR